MTEGTWNACALSPSCLRPGPGTWVEFRGLQLPGLSGLGVLLLAPQVPEKEASCRSVGRPCGRRLRSHSRGSTPQGQTRKGRVAGGVMNSPRENDAPRRPQRGRGASTAPRSLSDGNTSGFSPSLSFPTCTQRPCPAWWGWEGRGGVMLSDVERQGPPEGHPLSVPELLSLHIALGSWCSGVQLWAYRARGSKVCLGTDGRKRDIDGHAVPAVSLSLLQGQSASWGPLFQQG